jgi:hypothetical protein
MRAISFDWPVARMPFRISRSREANPPGPETDRRSFGKRKMFVFEQESSFEHAVNEIEFFRRVGRDRSSRETALSIPTRNRGDGIVGRTGRSARSHCRADFPTPVGAEEKHGVNQEDFFIAAGIPSTDFTKIQREVKATSPCAMITLYKALFLLDIFTFCLIIPAYSSLIIRSRNDV